MKSEKRIFLLLLLFLFTCGVVGTIAEQITLTTYYPSPRGDYETLRILPSTAGGDENDPCDATTEGGVIYYQQSPGQLLFCDVGAAGGPKWVPLGGDRFWKLQAADELVAKDDTWQLGIGTRVLSDHRITVSGGTTYHGIRAEGRIYGIETYGLEANSDGILAQGFTAGANATGPIMGVYGHGPSDGVVGWGINRGIVGEAIVDPCPEDGPSVDCNPNPLFGVYGRGLEIGVYGFGRDIGVKGEGRLYGVYSDVRPGDPSDTTYAFWGQDGDYGVWASGSIEGVHGIGGPTGVYGTGTSEGVYGNGTGSGNAGVYGTGETGVHGVGSAVGIYGVGPTAGYFEGQIIMTVAGAPALTGKLVYPPPADIAELIPTGKEVGPGDIVIINPHKERELVRTTQPYDERVAGVISEKPWFALGDKEKANEEDPGKNYQFITLAGQVECKVDASYGEIRPGDWLTTSPTPGHAMVVTDKSRSGGTVIGKALQGLKEGKGKILILARIGS